MKNGPWGVYEIYGTASPNLIKGGFRVKDSAKKFADKIRTYEREGSF